MFAAWVDYRKAIKNEERSDVINYINNMSGRNLDRSAMSHYINGSKAVPDHILLLVEKDYLEFLPWILTRCAIPTSKEQISNLVSFLRFPVKRT